MVIYAISSIERIKVVQNWEIKSLAPFKAVFVLFNNPVPFAAMPNRPV